MADVQAAFPMGGGRGFRQCRLRRVVNRRSDAAAQPLGSAGQDCGAQGWGVERAAVKRLALAGSKKDLP